MIISSCPLRISLFGGSTDNPYFVEKYGRGSVIRKLISLCMKINWDIMFRVKNISLIILREKKLNL